MSQTDPSREPNDPLLEALRRLPSYPVDPALDARTQRDARAAYLRRFDHDAGQRAARMTARAARLGVPVLLAGIVGLYMTWAIAAATALVQ